MNRKARWRWWTIALFIIIGISGCSQQSLYNDEVYEEPSWICDYNAYNCADFSTCSQAQAVLRECKEQGYGDIHDLDRDVDGVPCEKYQGSGLC
jgi:hypothetical protein